MKDFNIDEARAGKPVCTRDGDKAKIICFDRKDDVYPIVALLWETEEPRTFMINGRYSESLGETVRDLMMATVKKEGWVNIYKAKNSDWGRLVVRGDVFTSEKQAKQWCIQNPLYVTTVKIEWEE